MGFYVVGFPTCGSEFLDSWPSRPFFGISENAPHIKRRFFGQKCISQCGLANFLSHIVGARRADLGEFRVLWVNKNHLPTKPEPTSADQIQMKQNDPGSI